MPFLKHAGELPWPCMSIQPFDRAFSLWTDSLTWPGPLSLGLCLEIAELDPGHDMGIDFLAWLQVCLVATTPPYGLASWLHLAMTSGSVLLSCRSGWPLVVKVLPWQTRTFSSSWLPSLRWELCSCCSMGACSTALHVFVSTGFPEALPLVWVLLSPQHGPSTQPWWHGPTQAHLASLVMHSCTCIPPHLSCHVSFPVTTLDPGLCLLKYLPVFPRHLNYSKAGPCWADLCKMWGQTCLGREAPDQPWECAKTWPSPGLLQLPGVQGPRSDSGLYSPAPSRSQWGQAPASGSPALLSHGPCPSLAYPCTQGGACCTELGLLRCPHLLLLEVRWDLNDMGGPQAPGLHPHAACLSDTHLETNFKDGKGILRSSTFCESWTFRSSNKYCGWLPGKY